MHQALFLGYLSRKIIMLIIDENIFIFTFFSHIIALSTFSFFQNTVSRVYVGIRLYPSFLGRQNSSQQLKGKKNQDCREN